MSAFEIEILCGIAAVALLLYYYLTNTYDFWKNRGVNGPKPSLLFGNMKSVLLGQQSNADFSKELYDEFKSEPVIGLYARKKPFLMVKDLDLIKDILIKDFSVFANRGQKMHEKVEPLSLHLFNLEPERWRPLRTRLSPVFTSGKLKEMFYLMLECGDMYENYLGTLSSRNKPVDIRELAAKFTTDVIGSCAFGLNMNSLADGDSEFRKMGRKIFKPDWRNMLRFRLREMSSFVYNLVGPFLAQPGMNEFFIGSIRQTIEYRKKNNIVRHDFIDVLIDLEKHPEKLKGIEVTDNLLTSQAFVFFLAGFETSSSTMSNALYELALNPPIQNKLREEIREILEKEGKLTYDSVKKMTYLDKVFKETLRKYSIATILLRESEAEYTFENTKITIPKKTRIHIPVYAIQRDPEIYPDPDVFDPERFDEENVKKRHISAYLPFGEGSRNCIGARFAVYQTKVGIIKTLQNFSVEVCEETMIPYVNHPTAFILAPKDGIVLNVKRLNNN